MTITRPRLAEFLVLMTLLVCMIAGRSIATWNDSPKYVDKVIERLERGQPHPR